MQFIQGCRETRALKVEPRGKRESNSKLLLESKPRLLLGQMTDNGPGGGRQRLRCQKSNTFGGGREMHTFKRTCLVVLCTLTQERAERERLNLKRPPREKEKRRKRERELRNKRWKDFFHCRLYCLAHFTTLGRPTGKNLSRGQCHCHARGGKRGRVCVFFWVRDISSSRPPGPSP